MALLSIKDLTYSWGGLPLLQSVNLQIEPGERIGLVGRNGTGKSSLMAIMEGALTPESGALVRAQGLKTALLPQEVPPDLEGSVAEVVAGGIGSAEPRELREVSKVLSWMELDSAARFENLSAGLKRRVFLARALAGRPDLLLLDEPTNHLDIASIRWLEEFLSRYEGTLFFVTHDRFFLRNLATRIVDLDRGRLLSFECDYATYVQRKEEVLRAEEKDWDRFDKKLAKEEVWVRQGIKARRTRNEGRVKALKSLRKDRQERREKTGSVRMKVQDAQRTGRLVIEAKEVCHAFETDSPLVQDFSAMIMRGDKVGLIGPNGAGKTTLLRILLGQLEPQTGSVRHGTHLEVAYFDQLRRQLDEDQSVIHNVSGGNDTVFLNGKPRHIIGYLQDFLFSADRARSPVSFLSGGERNRLLLARLFTRPANVLVLDEPTNDLDTETLELLESLLVTFTGTVLLVSHDRTFLNHVVTSSLVFEGRGRVQEYVGGYDDWLVQRKSAQETVSFPRGKKKSAAGNKPESGKPRLTYLEKRELEALPQRIDDLEGALAGIHEAMTDPAFYQQDPAEIARVNARLKAVEEELDQATRRWEVLEERVG